MSFILNIVLLGRIFLSDQGYFAYQELKKEHMALEARLAAVEEENLGLSRTIRLLQKDDQYIEHVIRQRMNFVKDGEVLYIFPESRKQAGAVQDDGKD